MPSEANGLEIEGLNLKFGSRKIFENLALTVAREESVALLGPSGSGKSSLLSVALGLIVPNSGRVLVDGELMTKRRPDERARIRSNKIGMIFQFAELLPEMSPVDNVALPALFRETPGKLDPFQRARDLLDALHVPQMAKTENLSGGERQRTAVARALINEPRLVLADEPTGSLDQESRDQVAKMLFDLPRRYGCGLLIATHDLEVARLADRVFHVDSFQLTLSGAPE